MPNQASAYFRDGRSFPTLSQMLEAADDFDRLAGRGLGLGEIADRLCVSPGTVTVIRRWSIERAEGFTPQVEVRIS